MIEVRGLTKRYGATVAVSDLSFEVHPGSVTAFLGPNGAGKSTTMRMILGLDRPTAGTALIDGRPFALTYVHQSGNHLGPWTGIFIYAVWAVVPLVAGAVLLQRRDA